MRGFAFCCYGHWMVVLFIRCLKRNRYALGRASQSPLSLMIMLTWSRYPAVSYHDNKAMRRKETTNNLLFFSEFKHGLLVQWRIAHFAYRKIYSSESFNQYSYILSRPDLRKNITTWLKCYFLSLSSFLLYYSLLISHSTKGRVVSFVSDILRI